MIYEKIALSDNDENIYLEVYAPEKLQGFVRDGILVIPGGGYACVCYDREGEPIALDFVAKGLCAFVLHYSVGENAKFPRPLIEASKAMKYIKEHADLYGLNPDRVFATGFSAGGHLCASLGTLWHMDEIYKEIDMPYGFNKPCGIIPVYPVISALVPTHKGSFQNLTGSLEPTEAELLEYSLETRVDEKSAPAFILHTSTDQAVPVYNALAFAKAYADAKMPFELHIFREAPHGMALATKITEVGNPGWVNESAAEWTHLAYLWMKGIK
ncbi:MAG: alpha/beta hydrolase [Clostridia bacterium]|nr:alpha/beta hydrolase [Clostridia bacterium]